MLNFNIPWNGVGGGGDLVFGAMLLYGLLWLLTLGLSLTRIDLDPVTRLMWVIVVIFVPVCGVVLYFVLAPPRPLEPRLTRRRYESDRAGTPWEDDPGHRRGPS